MNSQLPLPGSVWLHKITSRLMRASISDESIVIAHNCEAAMQDPKIPMVSWSGTPETFARAFRPANPSNYPQTAKS